MGTRFRVWFTALFAAALAALGVSNAGAQQVTTLIQFTNVWKYDQTGLELGTAWRTNDYDDSAWPSGPGLLGFEDGLAPYQVHAPRLTPLTVSPAVTTFYFRTSFQFTGSLEGLTLFATNLVDDGCVIYLNGERVGGVRVPVSFNATTTFSGPTVEGQLDVVALTNLAALRRGANQLAVEVHQSSALSADVMFGMKLVAVNETPLVITNQPQSQAVTLGDPVTFTVGVEGGPVWYRWQKGGVFLGSTSNSLVISAASPASAGNYQVVCTNTLTVITSSVATLLVLADLNGPTVLSAIADNGYGPRSINIKFSEYLNTASARNTNHYTVTRLGTTSTVAFTNALYADGLGALLRLDANDPDWIPYADYVVTINNVADSMGNVIAPNTTVPVFWAYTTNLIRASRSWDFHASAIFEPEVFDEPWFDCDYVPGPWWGQGSGPFYGGLIAIPLCPALGAPQTIAGWQPEPILYRTTFSYPADWPASATLRLRTAFDDGLVLYLNGMEIYRNNVSGAAGSPVDGSTRSLTAVNPAPCLTNINIAVTNLSPGSNCLAAAVVGSNASDADSYFVLEVDATVLFAPTLPPEPLPILQATSLNTNSLRLAWTGGGYALESSTNLDLGPASYPTGPWTPVPQMSNPYLWSLTNSPARFFRLKK